MEIMQKVEFTLPDGQTHIGRIVDRLPNRLVRVSYLTPIGSNYRQANLITLKESEIKCIPSDC